MAKVNFGNIVAYARNKCGNVVYTRGRGGDATRIRVKGSNPKTPAQKLTRSIHSAITKRWSQTLTDNQRQAWTTLAATIERKDKIGNSYPSKGQTLYIQLNHQLGTAALGPIDTAPPPSVASDTGPIETAFASASTGQIYVTPSNAPGPNEIVQVRATKLLGPAVYNFNKYLVVLLNT